MNTRVSRILSLALICLSPAVVPACADDALPDLVVRAADIALTSPDTSLPVVMEPTADRQCVVVTVRNASATVGARDVRVQLSGGATLLEVGLIGEPALAGDIPPGGSASVALTWDLTGENVEHFALYAQAHSTAMGDANPADNAAVLEVSVWYAHNGERAFSLFDDTYRFASGRLDRSALIDVRDRMLGLVVGSMAASPDELNALAAVFGPLLEVRLQERAGGQCYGMVDSAAEYFRDASLKPVAKSVAAMTREDVRADLQIRGATQLLPMTTSLLVGEALFPVGWGPGNAVARAREALRGRRCAAVHLAWRDPETRRAVLGYKLIEVTGRAPVLYVYDPNHPVAAQPGSPGVMPQLTLGQSDWSWAGGTDFATHYAEGVHVAAIPDVPSSESHSDLRASLRGTVRELVADLQATGRFAAILSGPADALLVDAQGRRTGVVAGQVVNDIPGAEALATGEAEMYLAPAAGRYELTIAGTASGWADLTVLRADGSGRLEVRSFEDLPVTAGARVSVPVLPGGDAQAALTATGLSLPTVSGALDSDAAFWVTAVAPDQPTTTAVPSGMQPMSLAADSFVKRAVICLDIDEQGKLVGESNAFGFGVEKVGLYVRMVDAPPGSEVTLEWLHEGNPLHKQIIMIEGTHSSFTYLTAVNKPQLWEGAHAVIIRENGRHVGTVTFTVR